MNNLNRKSQFLINEVKSKLEKKGFKVIANFKSTINNKKIIINLIAINKKGVYLIKVKNLNAILTGDYKAKEWTSIYEDDVSYQVPNTMKHLYKSSLAIQILLSDYKIRPLTTTIFGDETNIRLQNMHPYSILKINNMNRFFESEKFKEKLTDEEVESIYIKLQNAIG